MISAIILAAGLSKRMKLGNKLLLEKNNVPIIKTTLERVAASKVNEIIVVLGKDSSLIKNKVNEDIINVFVPTTPNPTSGFLLMYPKDEVIYLDMSFEEASKFIVSAGTSDPSN